MTQATERLVAPVVLRRLTTDDPGSWGWWPELERRARLTAARFTPDLDPDKLIAHLRQLWIMTPMTLGVWLVMREVAASSNGHGPLETPVGHLIAWVVKDDWGEVMILVYHLAVDRKVRATSALDQGLVALDTWRQNLNVLYARQRPEGAPPVETITRYQFWTGRAGRAWERYFGTRVKVTSTRAVVTFEIPRGGE